MNYRLFNICFLLFTLFFSAGTAFSDSYIFLKQWGDQRVFPWLSKPRGVTVGAYGRVYVSASAQNSVYMYSPDGTLASWSNCDGTYLNNPMEMATDKTGDLYVVDNGNNRICVYDTLGNYKRKIEAGFNAPVGVAVDSSRNVYVTDRRNNVVKKFDSSGNLKETWPGFRAPWGITLSSSGHVYVTDGTPGGMVHKLNTNGSPVMRPDGITPLTWGSRGIGTGQFLMAEGIAVYEKLNQLYVADGEYGRIHVFDLNGNFQRTIGERGTGNGQLQFSTALAVDNTNGLLYVSDDDNDRVVRFNILASPTYAGQWGCDSSGATGLRYPTKIAIDEAHGFMYVVDSANHKVRQLTLYPNVAEVRSFGGYGTGNGQFRFPIDAAVDSGGNVYVVDNLNRTVQKFNQYGAFIRKYDFKQAPLLTTPLTYLYGLHAIAIDSSDRIFVVDAGTNSVHVLNALGNKTGTWAVNDYPTGIAIDEAAGFAYVTSFFPDATAQYNMSGAPTGKLIGQGNPEPFNDLFHPYSVTVDAGGNVLMADTFRNRLNKFGTNGPAGNFITTIGTLNWAGDNTPGQFTFPYGVALDSSGNVYAADTNNHRIQIFRPAPFSFTTVILGNGTIGCSPTVNYGGQQVCTITPDNGYYLSGLTDNGRPVAIAPGDAYKMSNVSSDHSIAATFRLIQMPPVRVIPGATAQYDNVMSAYASLVIDGNAIELQPVICPAEALDFNRDVSFALRGGVDFVLNTQSGYSIINPLTISLGSVVVDGIIIQ